jgi:hypothetical protein
VFEIEECLSKNDKSEETKSKTALISSDSQAP